MGKDPGDYRKLLQRYLEITPFPRTLGLEPASYAECYRRSGGDWQKFADLLDFSYGGRELGQTGTIDAERLVKSGRQCGSGCGSGGCSSTRSNCGSSCGGASGGSSGKDYSCQRVSFGGNGYGIFWEVLDRSLGVNMLMSAAARCGTAMRFANPHIYQVAQRYHTEKIELGLLCLSFTREINTEDALTVAFAEFAQLGSEPAEFAELMMFATNGQAVARQFPQVLAAGSLAHGVGNNCLAPFLKVNAGGDYTATDFAINANQRFPAAINPFYLLEVRSRRIV